MDLMSSNNESKNIPGIKRAQLPWLADLITSDDKPVQIAGRGQIHIARALARRGLCEVVKEPDTKAGISAEVRVTPAGVAYLRTHNDDLTAEQIAKVEKIATDQTA